jgi:hypothetical protein
MKAGGFETGFTPGRNLGCMVRSPFFKRPVEFQTSVFGDRWPGTRKFCGIPLLFDR